MLTVFKVNKTIEVKRSGSKCKEMVAIEVDGEKRKIHLLKQLGQNPLPRGAKLEVDIDGATTSPVYINGEKSTYKLRDVLFV